MDSITKICTRCKQEKAIVEFGKGKYECLRCRRERLKYFYSRHPEKHKEYNSGKSQEKLYVYQRRYREKHPEKVYEINKKYALDHRDSVNKNHKKWRDENPEKVAFFNHRNRTQRKGAEGSYTLEEWNRLCDNFNNKCLCCSEVKPLTVDHVIPLSKGGTNYIDNIQPLCISCNKKKGIKTIDYRCKTTS